MTHSTDKRERALEEKYGGKEALAAKRREWQAKSRENYKGGGGFRHLAEHDPERLKEISREAAKKRHAQAQDTPQSQD